MKIDAYTFGCVRVDGTAHRKDLILLPDGIHQNWWRQNGHDLRAEDLEILEDAAVEVLVVGTGAHGAMSVGRGLVKRLEEKGMDVEVYNTGQACERFNELRTQGKRVAAALHLTC